MKHLRRVFVVAATLFALHGCDKRGEPPTAGMPPLAGGTPITPGPGAVHPPTGANDPNGPGALAAPENLPPGHPALPAGHPQMGAAGDPIVGETPEGEFDPKATITGSLVLADKVKEKVQAGDVIFLVARTDDGTDKGTVLAVKKLVAGAWPQPFALDGSAPMFPGTKFEGKVLVSARVDKDGDGMTKNAGDVLGLLRVQIPSAGVKLVIDTVTQ